jgi:hypothetical protein
MPPVEEARSIFERLGYSVSGQGTELVAERKWRTVHVTALNHRDVTQSRPAVADGGRDRGDELRCFVTWNDYTGDLRERLRQLNPTYEWAIIGVDDGNSYEVVHGG